MKYNVLKTIFVFVPCPNDRPAAWLTETPYVVDSKAVTLTVLLERLQSVRVGGIYIVIGAYVLRERSVYTLRAGVQYTTPRCVDPRILGQIGRTEVARRRSSNGRKILMHEPTNTSRIENQGPLPPHPTRILLGIIRCCPTGGVCLPP